MVAVYSKPVNGYSKRLGVFSSVHDAYLVFRLSLCDLVVEYIR